ncbi:MAG: hypothetical protein IJ016_01705 [Elusimicrobiaceae bacterium]|nr:hypothetical protein [Elusimicrobiaceae bacterium]
MKAHYFQRYTQRENVATANTILLLSRFYQYSSGKFFRFLKENFLADSFEPELSFNLQVKKGQSSSVPDATIEQESFKIVLETKLNGEKFEVNQLIEHLKSFNNEKCKILLTLAPSRMVGKTKNEFESELKDCEKGAFPVIHVNLTFEELSQLIQKTLDERDYEMQDILDDYISYCEYDKLFSDKKNKLFVQLAGKTFDFNIENNLYYNKVSRGETPYGYLGLYKEKSARCIGKVFAKFIANGLEDIQLVDKYGKSIDDERKKECEKKIKLAMKENPDLLKRPHYYFFVEQFYETDFKKITPKAPLGMRKFDLTEILNQKDLPSTEKIAELLKTKTWE